jgi:hypothetical protein
MAWRYVYKASEEPNQPTPPIESSGMAATEFEFSEVNNHETALKNCSGFVDHYLINVTL